MTNRLVKWLHYLQGERRGMGSQLVMPDRFAQQLIPVVSLSPAILVSQSVLLADVSFYQGAIDFQGMRAAGISGVIIRAGQHTWPDSRFSENWSKAAAADLPRGSYWFYDSREDPKRQAALWWSLIKDDPGELVHAADLEEAYGGPYGKPEHFRTFVSEFQRLSQLPDDRIAIYTGYFWWQQRVGVDLSFKQYPLWLAWYADMSVVRIPAPWSVEELLFWQWTSSGNGPKYSVSSQEIDLSWYCCSQVHFNQRFNLNEPTNGGTMAQIIKGTAIGNVTRRKSPAGEAFTPARYLNKGDVITADRQDTTLPQWLHLTSINGVPVVGDEWASAGVDQKYIQWNWVDVTPPPDPEPEPAVYPVSAVVTMNDGTRWETTDFTKL
jgi:GH25 family lysozyme M1 (1,4-beta-N-acetylmuramidase)